MTKKNHGRNGINPILIRKIWQKYNLPRSTHGMKVQIVEASELQLFQQHEIEFNKMFQTLPKFAPNVLAHILTGGRPVTLGTVGFYLKFFLFALRENSSRPPPSPPLFSSSKPSGFVITPSPPLYFPQVKPQVKKNLNRGRLPNCFARFYLLN